MKIAIASTGKKENSEISSVAGRAPYFLFYEDKKLAKTIKNPFATGGGGAGFGVAKIMENEKADLIVAGHFGGKIIGALKEKNISKKELSGNIKEVLKKL